MRDLTNGVYRVVIISVMGSTLICCFFHLLLRLERTHICVLTRKRVTDAYTKRNSDMPLLDKITMYMESELRLPLFLLRW